MSCEPLGVVPPVPPWKEYLNGRYTDLGLAELSKPDGKLTDGQKMMFNAWCDPDKNMYVSYPDGRSTTPVGQSHKLNIYTEVDCVIPKNEWGPKWRTMHTNGVNPYDFLSKPIPWTRHELSNLVTRANHWWLEVDDPFTGRYAPGGSVDTNDIYHRLLSSTVFITGFIAVLSLLVVAARMAIQRNARPAGDAARGLFTLVVVLGIQLTFTMLLLQAGTRFSDWFIVEVLRDPNSNASACTVVNQNLEVIPKRFENMNFFMFLLCALFMLVASIVLFLYMLGRVFVITLLSGLMPMAAAGTATEAGREWFRKMLSYLFAFILIKPAATIVVVVSLRMSAVESVDDTISDDVASVVMLFMGTVLLPAMTRLAFPFVSPAAQGDKAAQAMAVAPIALGAKTVTGGLATFRR